MRVSTRPLLQLCVVGACAALLSPFAGAQEGVADSEALTALKALADKPGLMLGTGADSASEHFGIACTYISRAGGKGEWGWDLVAVRDGKRVVALVRSLRASGKSDTRAVLADGVVACVDPKNPGGLIVTERAWPVVQVGSAAGEFKFAFESAADAPVVVFDPASVIHGALATAREVKRGKDGQKIVVLTQRAGLGVTPAPAGGLVPCPVESLEFPTRDALLRISVIEPSWAEKFAALKPITVAAINGLGLPTRHPDPGELSKLLSPGRDDVEADPQRLAASKKLSDLPTQQGYHFPANAAGGESKS